MFHTKNQEKPGDMISATVSADLRPLAHTMFVEQPVQLQVHTENGTAAKCTNTGVGVERTGQQNNCRMDAVYSRVARYTK